MRSWKTAVLLATVALAARAPARADKPESGDEKPPHHEHHGDLTDEQHAKIKEIFAASRATMKARGEEMRVAVEKLRWQVDAKASDKDLEATLDAIDKARAALRDEREKTEKKIAAVLTPQQRAGFFLHMQGGHALPASGPRPGATVPSPRAWAAAVLPTGSIGAAATARIPATRTRRTTTVPETTTAADLPRVLDVRRGRRARPPRSAA